MSVIRFAIYANSLAKTVENLPGVDYIGIYADNVFAAASGNPQRISDNLNRLNYEINP